MVISVSADPCDGHQCQEDDECVPFARIGSISVAYYMCRLKPNITTTTVQRTSYFTQTTHHRQTRQTVRRITLLCHIKKNCWDI